MAAGIHVLNDTDDGDVDELCDSVNISEQTISRRPTSSSNYGCNRSRDDRLVSSHSQAPKATTNHDGN